MNAEAEQYLQRATRGLWGRRRREVREELAAHLAERVTAYRIAGLSEHDATDRALTELGSPRVVSAGMARLYTLPTVMGSSLAAAGTCLAVMALWPNVLAQPEVKANFYWPTAACMKAQQMDALYGACEEFSTLWLEPQSFKTEMRRQGVELDEGTSLSLTFPHGAFVSLTTEPHELMTGKTAIRTEPGVVALADLLRELSNQPGAVWFEGWDNPVVHIGKVTFRVGTTRHRVPGEKFYDEVLSAIFFKTLSAPLAGSETRMFYMVDPRREMSRTAVATEIRVAQPGIYGVVTSVDRKLLNSSWMPPEKAGDVFTAFEVVRSDEAGTLTVNVPRNVEFARTLRPADEFSTAVLVRFADDASTDARGYSMVLPEDITVVSNP